MKNKWLGGMIAISICILLGSYLSGIIYYLSFSTSPNAVTPLTFFEQFYYYYQLEPYHKHLVLSGLVGFGLSISLPLVAIYLHVKPRPEKLHGDARWATNAEIRGKGWFTTAPKGIVLGKLGKKFLIYAGDCFILLMSPTRGGKGISLIITNLLSWRDSVVVTDFKRENYYITSKWRQTILRQAVYMFDPFAEDGRTHRYNPLSYVSRGSLAVADINNISAAFYPNKSGNEGFWNGQARKLFLGLALMILERGDLPFTIGEVLRQSTGKGKPLKEYLQEQVDTKKASGIPFSDACLTQLYSVIGMSDNTLSNAINTFDAPLGNWSNPIFDAATSETDFDFRELRKKRIAIYIGITPDYLPVAQVILNLFFSQLINLNVKVLPEHDRSLKYTCLLLMDEFPLMGKIPELAKGVGFVAGYGLKIMTIAQSRWQILGADCYGKEGGTNYLSNHHVQVMHTVAKDDDETAKKISAQLGNKTVTVRSRQRAAGFWGKSSPTDTFSDVARPLMLPQELTTMDFWTEIIDVGGERPIKCEKIGYFKEPVFLDRLKQVSPMLRNFKKQIPNKEQFQLIIASGEMMMPLPLPVTDKLIAIPLPTEAQVAAFEHGAVIGVDDAPYPDSDTAQSELNNATEAKATAFVAQAESLNTLGDMPDF